MKPVVSIITPTYNRLHTLPRCWESIKHQTLTDFQWIVIDDGSSDGTGDWIKGLNNGAGDKRIVYHWQENKGMNHAKNHGMKYVAGDYVTYLDSDDTFYGKTSLAEMVDAIKLAPPPPISEMILALSISRWWMRRGSGVMTISPKIA